LLDEVLRWSSGEVFVERDDEKMLNAQITDQRDLVLGGSEQMRCIVWPQHLERMWIERDDDRFSAGRLRMAC
jgi:hypothetical protein